jgi:hypothetical protein
MWRAILAAQLVSSKCSFHSPGRMKLYGVFANFKSSANLANHSQIMQNDAAKWPSRVVPPSQTSGSAVFNNQSTKDRLMGFHSPSGQDGTLRPMGLESMSLPAPHSIISISTRSSFLVPFQAPSHTPSLSLGSNPPSARSCTASNVGAIELHDPGFIPTV